MYVFLGAAMLLRKPGIRFRIQLLKLGAWRTLIYNSKWHIGYRIQDVAAWAMILMQELWGGCMSQDFVSGYLEFSFKVFFSALLLQLKNFSNLRSFGAAFTWDFFASSQIVYFQSLRLIILNKQISSGSSIRMFLVSAVYCLNSSIQLAVHFVHPGKFLAV